MNAQENVSCLPLWRTGLIIGAALMGLLTLTLVLAYIPLGGFNVAVSYTIALAKASLVALVFMKLRTSPVLLSLAALAGLFWLLTLFALTLTDFPFRLAGEQITTFPAEQTSSPAGALPNRVLD